MGGCLIENTEGRPDLTVVWALAPGFARLSGTVIGASRKIVYTASVCNDRGIVAIPCILTNSHNQILLQTTPILPASNQKLKHQHQA